MRASRSTSTTGSARAAGTSRAARAVVAGAVGVVRSGTRRGCDCGRTRADTCGREGTLRCLACLVRRRYTRVLRAVLRVVGRIGFIRLSLALRP